MKDMQFTHAERTFTCRAEGSASSPETLWWWMSVSGESSRYAAFRAEARDTAKTLQPRIIAYYEQLLAARARPAETRAHWSQNRRAQAAEKPVSEAGTAA